MPRIRKALSFIADAFGAVVAVSVVVGLLSGLVGAVFTFVAGPSAIGSFALGALAGAILGGVVSMRILLLRNPAARTALRGYRWLSASYVYFIDPDDPTKHRQRVEIEIEALRDGIRWFSNQYLWSGHGQDPGPRAVSPGHSILGTPVSRSGWRHYVVDLGEQLRRGGRTRVFIEHDLRDDDREFECFLGKAVQEPVVSLSLQVHLPRALSPDAVRYIERDGLGAQARELAVQDGTYDPVTETISWSTEKPRYHHNYEIRWLYDGGSTIYEVARERTQGFPLPKGNDGELAL